MPSLGSSWVPVRCPVEPQSHAVAVARDGVRLTHQVVPGLDGEPVPPRAGNHSNSHVATIGFFDRRNVDAWWREPRAADIEDVADELTARQISLSLGGSVYDPTDAVGRLLFN